MRRPRCAGPWMDTSGVPPDDRRASAAGGRGGGDRGAAGPGEGGLGVPVAAAGHRCLVRRPGGGDLGGGRRRGVAGRAVAARRGAGVCGVAGVALVGRLVVCGVRLARAGAVRRREHLHVLALAGRRSAELGATVVECAEPAAYMLAGRDRRVVVTTGAVDALSAGELAAVLAHERAHAAGRHDLLLAGVRLLRAAFPHVVLFAVARAQLGRLVELRADDFAVASHPRISLARALVAMATHTGAAASVVPVGAVAAAGGDAAERLRRLLEPPARLSSLQRAAVAAGIAALALAPAALLVAAQVFPVLGMCPAL